MPVSTRSLITSHGQNEPNPEERIRTRADQEDDTVSSLPLRNPHHGLKEKLRALTVLYERQKQASASLRKEDTKPKPHNVMRENTMFNSTITRTYVLPQPPSEDAKENLVSGTDQIVGFSTTVARKLPMELRENRGARSVGESEKRQVVSEKPSRIGSRILVFVRLRPMAKKEKEAGSRSCVRIVKRRDVYLTEFANENDYLRLNRVRGRHFTFDASFPESATQQEVYSTTSSELVEAVLEGRNGSVFCYGATGAGKTYTMLGTVENPGVMVLAIKDLFSKIRLRSCDGSHAVHLSYLEVYNEHVRDLLCPGRPLVLREDKQGIVAAGLTQYRAYSADEVMALLQQGNQNRTTEPTRANETSSRSHAILQVVVEYQVRDGAMNVSSRMGKLSLIDLAGSERALATDQRTVRSLEGANINRSLLALSSCINALVEAKKHIPYRNSKLTQLLKDSLGGTCNTVMIANISPSNLSFGETQNTLHWADRAKEIRPQACDANEDFVAMPQKETDQAKLILELQKENRELRTQLERHQQKLMTLQAQSLAATPPPPSSSANSLLTPPAYSSSSAKQRKPRTTTACFLPKTCFTPDSDKVGGGNAQVRALQRTVRNLEAEMEKMKREHELKMKQKDDLIRALSQKKAVKEEAADVAAARREVVAKTTSTTRPKPGNSADPKIASSSHRFRSPPAKKRTFWDITAASSPSVATLSGRKTRSHAVSEASAPPSMLLQPGFARPKAII